MSLTSEVITALERITHPDPRIHNRAGAFLAAHGSAEVVEELKRLLGTDNEFARTCIVRNLSLLDGAAIERAHLAVHDPSVHVRNACVALWNQERPETKEVFSQALHDPSVRVRQTALVKISETRSPVYIPDVRPHLGAAAWYEAWLACYCLYRLGARDQEVLRSAVELDAAPEAEEFNRGTEITRAAVAAAHAEDKVIPFPTTSELVRLLRSPSD